MHTAGGDMRVIFKQPKNSVNARDIENHKISLIPLATAGGVTDAIAGEIIVMLNQHVYYNTGKTTHLPGHIGSCKNALE